MNTNLVVANPGGLRAKTWPAIIRILALAFIPGFFTGCASIVDHGPKAIHFNSNPEGAKVTIYDRTGKEISVNTTPAIVPLDRGGFYHWDWYKVDFDMPGYQQYETRINPTLNPWYFGNILFGGFLGILIVDPATGCMWTLHPSEVNCDFVPVTQTSPPAQAVPPHPGGS